MSQAETPQGVGEIAPVTPPEPAVQGKTTDEESRFPRGLIIRLIAYLVAGHVFAGFLYLLFTVGSHGH